MKRTSRIASDLEAAHTTELSRIQQKRPRVTSSRPFCLLKITSFLHGELPAAEGAAYLFGEVDGVRHGFEERLFLLHVLGIVSPGEPYGNYGGDGARTTSTDQFEMGKSVSNTLSVLFFQLSQPAPSFTTPPVKA